MRFVKIALALAAVALLAVPVTASAAKKKHHVITCPKGKHRNGKKCVKNWQAAKRGPAGPAGPKGPTGSTGQPPSLSRTTVYDNITPLASRPRSYSIAGLAFDEIGSLVSLAGTNRNNPEVNFETAVYACETGLYTSGCSTTPGTKFEVPMTVQFYSVAAGQEPGALIGAVTVNQQLHYRPTSDPTCASTPEYEGGFRNSHGECANGQLQPVSFNLAGVTLPSEVIVSLSYNTVNAGYGTHIPANAPANSVNIALAGPAAVGTTLRETEGSYFASGFYGSGDDVFQYQADEEFHETVGAEPAISISATN